MTNHHLFIKQQLSVNEAEITSRFASEAVYEFDVLSGNYNYISSGINAVLGYTPEELIDIELKSLIVDTGHISSNATTRLNTYYDVLDYRLKGNLGKVVAEYLLSTKDAGYKWVRDSSEAIVASTGEIKIIGVIRDISELAEQETKAKELLDKIACKDDLTKLGNREAYFKTLESELKRLERNYEPLSSIVVSVQNFLQYQSYYGKELTDKAIFQIGRTLKQSTRNIDAVFRTGEGEFSIIMPYTAKAGAEVLIKRLDAIFARTQNRNLSDKTVLRYALNFGLSTATAGSTKPFDLYKDAIVNLYILSHPQNLVPAAEQKLANNSSVVH
jgi:diguanylate cyclase (GGDEF)-like protein